MRRTLAIACCSIIGAAALFGCRPGAHELSSNRLAMGTTLRIVLFAADGDQARAAMEAAYAEVSRLEDILSIFKPSSDVAVLNERQRLLLASDDTLLVLRRAYVWSALSDGAFDITVEPILELYKESFATTGSPPSESAIHKALRLVDYRLVQIDGQSVRIGRGQRLTLGAIGHGYAADKAIEILRRNGIADALVDVGGAIRVIGQKEGRRPWRIALADPRNPSAAMAAIDLAPEKAVATSGDYEQHFDSARRYHHIINPRNGHSPTELSSVTILADNATDADALSTAVFVLGKEKGLALIEKLGNAAALVVSRAGEVIRSARFPCVYP